MAYQKISLMIKKARREVYQTLPQELRAIHAMSRISSRPKRAFSKGDINRLVNQLLRSEGIEQELQDEGLEVPNIDWGEIFLIAINQMARKYNMSPTMREDFLSDVVGDMVMGQSIITVRDTGPWRLSLTEQIEEWIRDGYNEGRIKGSLINWIKNKVANLYERWKAQRGHTDDIGFEVGSPDDEYRGRDVYENLFQLDGLSSGQMSNYHSLIRQTPEVRDIVNRITKQLERQDDALGYLWQAYMKDPAASMLDLLTIPVDATVDNRRQTVPLWQAMGYDGPDQSRQRIDYQIKKLRSHLKRMWPDIDDVLRDIKSASVKIAGGYMGNLKDQLIRIGSTRPELQNHLKPILAHLDGKVAFDGVIEDEDWDNAPANWQGYDVSMTYETVTPESAEFGEAEDRGWELEDDNYETLSDVVRSFRNKNWLGWSSSNPGPRDWIYSEGETDFRSGETTTYNLFIRRADGKPLSRREIGYLTREWRLR